MNEFAAQWADQLWRACWQGALTALAALILLAVWKRAPSQVRCWIWWLVCLKTLICLIPVNVEVPLLPTEPDEVVTAPANAQFVATYSPSLVEVPITEQKTEPMVYVLAIWGLLAMGVAAIATRPTLKLWQTIRSSEPLSPDLAFVAVSASIPLRLKRTPRVVITKDPIGPLAVGLFRPVVIIPETTIRTCTTEELRWILAHEFAHLQRRDALFGAVPQLAQALFAFNPLVWLACREYGLAREAACDEIALGAYSMPRDVYATLLLRLGVSSRAALCSPGVSPHFRNLHRRITMLESSDRPSSPWSRRLAPLSALAAALVLAPLTLVHAQNAPPPPPPPARPGDPTSPIAPPRPARPSSGVKVPQGDRATMVPVQYTDAASVAAKLRKQFKTGVRVLVDTNANVIIIVASPAKTKQVEKAMAKLDKGSGRLMPPRPPLPGSPAIAPSGVVVSPRSPIAAPTPPPPPGAPAQVPFPSSSDPVGRPSAMQLPTPAQPGAIPSGVIPGTPRLSVPSAAPGGEVPISKTPEPATSLPGQVPSRGAPQPALAPSGQLPISRTPDPAIASTGVVAPGRSAPQPALTPGGQLPTARIAEPAIAPTGQLPAMAAPYVTAAAVPTVPATATAIYHLKHTTASKAAKALNKKFAGKAPWVWVDERSNSILVQGNLQRRAEVNKFLANFDKKK